MKKPPHLFSWKSVLVATLLMMASAVRAEVVQLTAEFVPSVANPKYEFVNTTPSEGICREYPDKCPPGSFSILTGVTITDRIYSNDASPLSQQNYQALDAEFKDIEMIHASTGERAIVRFRINVLTQRIHNRWQDIAEPNAYDKPLGGCTGFVGAGGATTRWVWEYPNTSGIRPCYVTTLPTTNRTVFVDDISLGYQMVTPDPLRMASGTWTGSITYTFGSGQQIDFGEGNYSTNQVEFQITANVGHVFDVRQLPGSERVVLAPKGGWEQWLNSQTTPPKLMKDVTFIMSSSGPFNVSLDCEYSEADTCGIMNTDNGDVVPLDILLTLPGINYQGTDAPATRTRLRHIFGPGSNFYSRGFDSSYFNSRSTIHFEVAKPHLEEMLKQPGSTWQGRVTLIFDAYI